MITRYTVKFGRIELEVTSQESHNSLRAVIRNSIGQGWGLPLDDLRPKDLRDLADFLNSIGHADDKIIVENPVWVLMESNNEPSSN